MEIYDRKCQKHERRLQDNEEKAEEASIHRNALLKPGSLPQPATEIREELDVYVGHVDRAETDRCPAALAVVIVSGKRLKAMATDRGLIDRWISVQVEVVFVIWHLPAFR